LKKPNQLLLFILLTYTSIIFAQDTIPVFDYGETIVVTASRIPTTLQNLSRSLIILDQTFIKAAPVHNVLELLEYAAGIDMRQQGPPGVMGHVGIRGANYEQTSILLNGAKINDPQTGHHNFHLPIDLNHIEKIEILKGPASRLYGPNAFAGAINIITKRTKNKSLNLQGSYGEDQTYNGFTTLNLKSNKLHQQLSLSTHGSDGYRKNTDYQIFTGSYSMDIDLKNASVDFYGGYTDKEFGANQFYGSSSELQWEETNTTFLSSGLKIHGQNTSFTSKLSWRQNKDHYIWNKQHPEWYENFHTSNVYTAEAQLNLTTSLGTLVFGAELSEENINSKNLGDHSRQRLGLFAEQHFNLFERISLLPGASLFYYSDWGWRLWPGIDAEYQLQTNHNLYATYGQAFRVPTYTELYYRDPNNQGNPNLKAEDVWTIETGYRYTTWNFSAQTALFLRQSANLIDWIKIPLDSVWVARNFTEVNTQGLEIDLMWQNPGQKIGFAINRIKMNYTYLYSNKNVNEFISKYEANHLRHQWNFQININLGLYGLVQFFNIRYEDRLNFGDHFLADTRLSWQGNKLSLFADINNIFDIAYQEYLLIPMPGRKFTLGMAYSLFDQ
jgi:vitamin B12 transporter